MANGASQICAVPRDKSGDKVVLDRKSISLWVLPGARCQQVRRQGASGGSSERPWSFTGGCASPRADDAGGGLEFLPLPHVTAGRRPGSCSLCGCSERGSNDAAALD